jgi:hypothetical protein
MVSSLNVNDFRAGVAELGRGAIQADQDQAGLVQGSSGAWLKSLFNIGGAREANARTLDALRQAVHNDPAYARVAGQADALLGRLGSTFPLTGKKISQVLNKLDAAFAQQGPVQGNIPIRKTPAADLAAAREAAGRAFMSDVSNVIQKEMKIFMGGRSPSTFEKDITRGGPRLTIGGTTLRGLREIPEESLIRPGETVDEDTLTARRKGAALENGYNAIARLVTGRDDAVFSELEPADKTKAMILASIANQSPEGSTLTYGLRAVAPDFENPSSSNCFMLGQGQGGRNISVDKNPNGDFSIRINFEKPVSNVSRMGDQVSTPLDAARSGVSVAATLTISRGEMDRLSLLDWTKEGALPPEYQTAFSEHSLAGEMRLFRAE